MFDEVRVYSLGSYKWISVEETSVITLDDWEEERHFCSYPSAKGKWVMTCKSNLDKVIIWIKATHSQIITECKEVALVNL